MNTGASHKKSPLKFFVLVFLLTVPFWVLDTLGDAQIVPGVPLAGLAFVCPAIAAVILGYRGSGSEGVRALLRRSFDFNRIKAKAWYIPTLLLYPAVLVLSFFMLRLTGTYVPDPQISLASTLLLGVGFFIGALGEELGWSGYAIEPMQERWGALSASLILGSIWAVWHWVSLVQVHRSVSWIAWWSLYTVALRVITVWLFNNTGRSVFAVTLFHMTCNLSWQLFPISGSHFNQPLVAVLMAIVAIVIPFIWAPGTLATYRYTHAGNTMD